MVKKAKYKPIGKELDYTVAFLQATSALDYAVKMAIKNGNVDAVLQAAGMWIGLAELLGPGPNSDDDDDEDSGEVLSDHPMGFESNAQAELRRRREIERSNQSDV